jgi:Flp pilus assembly protein TadD
MVSIKYTKRVVFSCFIVAVSACSSTPSSTKSGAAKQPVDIYAQLKNDKAEFATGEVKEVEGSPQYVEENLVEARTEYLHRKFDNVKKICTRILRVAPSATEAYYWLARVAIDEGDYQQGYDMASKGLLVAKEPNMKRELQDMKKMTEMGAK